MKAGPGGPVRATRARLLGAVASTTVGVLGALLWLVASGEDERVVESFAALPSNEAKEDPPTRTAAPTNGEPAPVRELIELDGPAPAGGAEARGNTEPVAPRESISGWVLDPQGEPVDAAYVALCGDDPLVGGITDLDGWFCIDRAADHPDGPFALRVEAEGHDTVQTPPVHHWGARELRIVLPVGIDLTVAARRASDGAAVSGFIVRVVREVEDGRDEEPMRRQVRERGERADGTVVLVGLPRGRYRVHVEPPVDSWLGVARAVDVELGHRNHRISVDLPRLAERVVRVVRSDHEPAACSTVELLELDPDGTTIWDRTVVTDADGTAILTGPSDREFVVRMSGPTHLDHVTAGVRLVHPQPLTIVVPVGATVVARVQPAALVRQLGAAGKPGVTLSSMAGRGLSRSFGDVTQLAADGSSFTVARIPAGDWALNLSFRTVGGRAAILRDLRDGERREIVIDVGGWRPVMVRGTVRVDGERCSGRLHWERVTETEGGVGPFGSMAALTEESGSFEAWLTTGTWRAMFRPGGFGHALVASEPVVVDHSGPLAVELSVATARRRVRVLAPDGTPAVLLALGVEGIAHTNAWAASTDLDGWTVITGNPGRYALSAQPRSVDPDLVAEAYLSSGGDTADGWTALTAALTATRIELGTIEIGSADATDFELRLPPEWDR